MSEAEAPYGKIFLVQKVVLKKNRPPSAAENPILSTSISILGPKKFAKMAKKHFLDPLRGGRGGGPHPPRRGPKIALQGSPWGWYFDSRQLGWHKYALGGTSVGPSVARVP